MGEMSHRLLERDIGKEVCGVPQTFLIKIWLFALFGVFFASRCVPNIRVCVLCN